MRPSRRGARERRLDLVAHALDRLGGLRGDEELARIRAVLGVHRPGGQGEVGGAGGHRGQAEPARPARARGPDGLDADAREQQQRQQRVEHQPGELLARPRVDGQRDDEAPDQEQPQQRRAPHGDRRADGAEQEHRPLLGEQHDEVEEPRLPAAPDVVLAEPVGEAVVQSGPQAGRIGQEGREEQREGPGEGDDAPAPRLPRHRAQRPQHGRAPAGAGQAPAGRSSRPRRP